MAAQRECGRSRPRDNSNGAAAAVQAHAHGGRREGSMRSPMRAVRYRGGEGNVRQHVGSDCS
eukprot:664114-Pyramimonas_sp.AAC.1